MGKCLDSDWLRAIEFQGNTVQRKGKTIYLYRITVLTLYYIRKTHLFVSGIIQQYSLREISPAIIRLWVRFPSGIQKVFLREQLESVRIKNTITKLPQTHH